MVLAEHDIVITTYQTLSRDFGGLQGTKGQKKAKGAGKGRRKKKGAVESDADDEGEEKGEGGSPKEGGEKKGGDQEGAGKGTGQNGEPNALRTVQADSIQTLFGGLEELFASERVGRGRGRGKGKGRKLTTHQRYQELSELRARCVDGHGCC